MCVREKFLKMLQKSDKIVAEIGKNPRKIQEKIERIKNFWSKTGLNEIITKNYELKRNGHLTEY